MARSSGKSGFGAEIAQRSRSFLGTVVPRTETVSPPAGRNGVVVVADSSVVRASANPPAPPAIRAATTSNVERVGSASLTEQSMADPA